MDRAAQPSSSGPDDVEGGASPSDVSPADPFDPCDLRPGYPVPRGFRPRLPGLDAEVLGCNFDEDYDDDDFGAFDDSDDFDDLDDEDGDLEDGRDRRAAGIGLGGLLGLDDPRTPDDRPATDCLLAVGGAEHLELDAHLDAMASLDQIAERLDAVIPADSPPVWIRLLRSKPFPLGSAPEIPLPETVEINLDFPSLLGWNAPQNCLAVAVVATGRAFPLEAGAPVRRPPRRSQGYEDVGDTRARTVCVIDRWGRIAGRTKLGDAPVVIGPPGGGRLHDALLRCFSLPTAPPAVGSVELLNRMWLGSIAAATEESRLALGWKQVRRLHPSVSPVRTTGAPLTEEVLDAAMRVAPQAWTWDHIKSQAADGRWHSNLVEPELAAWMDEGMFSRWVLEGTRTTEELLEAVNPHLVQAARRKLRRALG